MVIGLKWYLIRQSFEAHIHCGTDVRRSYEAHIHCGRDIKRFYEIVFRFGMGYVLN